MAINKSQYKEQNIEIGVMCDKRSNDPKGIGEARIHNMNQFNLNPPDDCQWALSLSSTHSQIFSGKEKLKDGEHGIGETPNNFLKGTMLASMKPFADGQSSIILGAIPRVQTKVE